MFFGGLILFAAVIAWGTALGMSPHGTSVAEGTEHVRGTVVSLLTKAALITLVLTALSAWLLFPTRRPKAPRRDYAILALITLLVVTCVYELAWLQLSVLR
jgi:cytochrome bd-type quinol oxidase subunit 2